MQRKQTLSELPELIIDRVFDAPRELVWRAWTEPEILHRWYGPNIETVIHTFDLKPGGSRRNEMKMGANSDFSVMIFQEVAPPSRLVWHHSSSDSDWNITSNAMMPGAHHMNGEVPNSTQVRLTSSKLK